MVDPFPAVSEQEATGEVAAVFADLRATMGVPFVNLIWRHLATVPGALPAVWALVRPVYASAALVDAATALRQGVAVPAGLVVPAAAWACAGVDTGARAEIGRLIDDYGRANAANYLALSVACTVLRGDGQSQAVAAPGRDAVASEAARPLPAMADLAEPVQALVRDLDRFGRLRPSTALASLYRHLGYWPGFLAVAFVGLRPLHEGGVFETGQRELLAEAQAAVARLLPLAGAAPALDPAARAQVLATLEEFLALMIGRMVVIGAALGRLVAGGGVSALPGRAAVADPASVDAAITGRRSVRGFLPDPVDEATVTRLLELAGRAPSGSNIQPWRAHVLTGAALTRLSEALLAAHEAGTPEEREYEYYPVHWREPYLARRRKVGWQLYELAGVARGDRDGAQRQRGRNYVFFGAPAALVFTMDRDLETGSWLDYGMFLQTLMIAARGHGLDTCPQAAIANYAFIVKQQLGVPDGQIVVCGMALGRADPAEPANALVADREPVAAFTVFHR